MADLTIYLGNRNDSSRSLRPWPAPRQAGAAFEEVAIPLALRPGPEGGDFLSGGFCIADAMFAPVVSRFRTYDATPDAVSAAYVEAVWNRPPMPEWAAAAEAEPWTVRFDA